MIDNLQTQNSKLKTQNSLNIHQPSIEILHQHNVMILEKELREMESSNLADHHSQACSLRHKMESIKNTIAFLQTQGGKS